MDEDIRTMRRFNRFYTRFLEGFGGVFGGRYLDSPLSLAQTRLLYEIQAAPGCTATELMAALGLDRGHASRLIKEMVSRGLVRREVDRQDRRARILRATAKGGRLLERLKAETEARVRDILAPLSPFERRELLEAYAAVERILGRGANRRAKKDDSRS